MMMIQMILRQALSGFQMDDAARLAKAGLAQIEGGASADEAAMRAQLQAALESAQSLRYAHEQATARMAHGEAAAAARDPPAIGFQPCGGRRLYLRGPAAPRVQLCHG